MNLNIKGQNGHSPFHYTKTGTKQSFNSKEVPSFCIKKTEVDILINHKASDKYCF